MINRACFLLAISLIPLALWSQEDITATRITSSGSDDSRMLVPPPVSTEAYPIEVGSESRSNYMLAGLTFNTAYSDNVLGGISAHGPSDVSYSIWPSIALDETTPRLHSIFTYDPGFTFYQRVSARNEADQNLGLELSYRLSPHVTLDLGDSFHKSSNILNQPDLLSANPVSGSPQVSAVSLIPPIADQMSNWGNVELTYQFALNSMVGATGRFTNVLYPDPAQVPGIYDSSSKGGSAFYSHRFSAKYYMGLIYQYEDLLAYPPGLLAQTQTHSALLFYTVYFKPTFSLSFFGGPQYSDTQESVLPTNHSLSPAAGASLGWQGQHTNFALSYSRMIAPGNGLIGAANEDAANTSIRRQLTRTLSIGAYASYTNNKLLDPLLSATVVNFSTGGHTIAGTASLDRQLHERFDLNLGYTRIRQSYGGFTGIPVAPNINREWVSISYKFSRPLGR